MAPTANKEGAAASCTNMLAQVGGALQRHRLMHHPRRMQDNGVCNGRRSVLLTCKDKVTHMLACNGGDIYLHKLSTPFTPQEPPSLENAPGGFRHDYRVNDMVNLINKHTLYPSQSGALGAVEANKAALEQYTRVFPLVNSESALYSISGTQSVDKILQIVPKSTLTEIDKIELQNATQVLMEKELNKEPIPWSSGSQGGKPPKKDEQYKILWSELNGNQGQVGVDEQM